MPKKNFGELVCIKSLKNQMKDTVNSWKNFFRYLKS